MGHGSTWRCGYFAALACAVGLVGAPAAWATASMSLTSELPAELTVGEQGVGSITVTNTSTAPQNESTGALVMANLTLVPACGQTPLAADCPPGFRDPGVVSLGNSALGAEGTACAGVSFVVSTIDQAQGKVQFVPSTPVLLALGRPGQSPACRIGFTVDVLKMPVFDADPATPGIQTGRVALATAKHSDGVSSAATIAPQLSPTFAPAGVDISASADGGLLGLPTTDTAVLTANPAAPALTGTLTFSLYGSDDETCAGAPLFTTAKPVSGGGTYVSEPVALTAIGTYSWVASYSGDANNAPAGTACGDPGQVVAVRSVDVVTGPANGVGRIGATLTGSVNTGGASPATSYLFEYGPTLAYGYQTAATALGPGSGAVPAAAIPTDLRAGTGYHYRLVATTAGRSDTGADRAFTTRPKAAAKRISVRTTPRRDRSAPYRFAFRGKLVLPSTIAHAQGCVGSVTIRATSRRRTVSTVRAKLTGQCHYARRLTISRDALSTIRRDARGLRRLKVTVAFYGNRLVRSTSTATGIRIG